MNVVVDIADMAISTNTGDVLITYSLGSCLGIAVYDPVNVVGGLMHCMLPLSKIDASKAAEKPYMFVDTGMQAFLGALYKQGLQKKNALVKVAGGARVMDRNDLFKIGERNYTVLKKVLWKNGLLIKGEHVGGAETRTVRLDMSTGDYHIKATAGAVINKVVL